ncbi:MAG: clostripain-related cysteine peptidase [bacterium]
MRIFIINLFIFSLLFSTYIFSADWTIIVYLDADNDLHIAGLDDVNEMESCQDSEDVNIIVLFDGNGNGDSVIYEIQHDDDMNRITSPIVDDGGVVIPDNRECDMGDWETLNRFTNWSVERYPAEHYLIDLWDHGTGIFFLNDGNYLRPLFKGFCWDNHGTGPIYLWEIDKVLKKLKSKIGRKVDIVGFDACVLGQIETAYQLKDWTNIVVASEASEPEDGWDYTAFDNVRKNPYISPRQLATDIVDCYLKSYNGGVTMSAQDASIIDSQLVPKLNDFSNALWKYTYHYYDRISAIRTDTTHFNPPNKDLYNFAKYISEDLSVPSELKDSAKDFCSVWNSYIIAGGLHSHPPDAGYGATVWFPLHISEERDMSKYMNELTFHNTKWDEFLYMFDEPYPPNSICIRYVDYKIDDVKNGNGNGVPEPGEEIELIVRVRNISDRNAHNVIGKLTADSSKINIKVGTANYGDIPSFDVREGIFIIRIEDGIKTPLFCEMEIKLKSSDPYETSESFHFTVGFGFSDNVENGEGYWMHRGNSDMWHIEGSRFCSPTHSWKCGGIGRQEYINEMNCSLYSPVLYVNEDIARLNYWTWYYTEPLADFCYVDIKVGDNDWLCKKTYSGKIGNWIQDIIDLSEYINKPIQIRFRFKSDYMTNYEGWYIDNICLGSMVDVDLEYFKAIPKDSACLLQWKTAMDDPTLIGFNLYRRIINCAYEKHIFESSLSPTSVSVVDNRDNGYIKVNDELIKGSGNFSFTDSYLDNGITYQYLLEAVYSDKMEDLASTFATPKRDIPTSLSLKQNYPNPFDKKTTVEFDIPKPSVVNLSIYDISGRKVKAIINQYMNVGSYKMDIGIISDDGALMQNGVYILRLSTDYDSATIKMLIQR